MLFRATLSYFPYYNVSLWKTRILWFINQSRDNMVEKRLFNIALLLFDSCLSMYFHTYISVL